MFIVNYTYYTSLNTHTNYISLSKTQLLYSTILALMSYATSFLIPFATLCLYLHYQPAGYFPLFLNLLATVSTFFNFKFLLLSFLKFEGSWSSLTLNCYYYLLLSLSSQLNVHMMWKQLIMLKSISQFSQLLSHVCVTES